MPPNTNTTTKTSSSTLCSTASATNSTSTITTATRTNTKCQAATKSNYVASQNVRRSLRIGSLNICRALHRKETDISIKLQKLKLDVLFLLETDVKNIDLKNPPNFEGYTTICPLKTSKETTRILALVKQTLKSKKREDLMCRDISSIWIEVISEIGEKFLLGGIYREFDDLEGKENSKSIDSQSIRLGKFFSQLEKAENEKCTVIGIGDLNLNAKKWHLNDYKYKKTKQPIQGND